MRDHALSHAKSDSEPDADSGFVNVTTAGNPNARKS
jgi:hypothetical protein